LAGAAVVRTFVSTKRSNRFQASGCISISSRPAGFFADLAGDFIGSNLFQNRSERKESLGARDGIEPAFTPVGVRACMPGDQACAVHRAEVHLSKHKRHPPGWRCALGAARCWSWITDPRPSGFDSHRLHRQRIMRRIWRSSPVSWACCVKYTIAPLREGKKRSVTGGQLSGRSTAIRAPGAGLRRSGRCSSLWRSRRARIWPRRCPEGPPG
jgi:hypothetical protein